MKLCFRSSVLDFLGVSEANLMSKRPILGLLATMCCIGLEFIRCIISRAKTTHLNSALEVCYTGSSGSEFLYQNIVFHFFYRFHPRIAWKGLELQIF